VRRLYFLRHGKAVARSAWTGEDGLRPLTPDGEQTMRREAQALAGLDLAPDVIVTSPLVRARQTADIVAGALGLGDGVVDDKRLAHGFDARALSRIVAAHDDASRLMLVGHEPEFSLVIGELIGGGALVLKKGGIARIDLAPGTAKRGELVWLLSPPLLGAE
jgi:phosphohistidine phosphatase